MPNQKECTTAMKGDNCLLISHRNPSNESKDVSAFTSIGACSINPGFGNVLVAVLTLSEDDSSGGGATGLSSVVEGDEGSGGGGKGAFSHFVFDGNTAE